MPVGTGDGSEAIFASEEGHFSVSRTNRHIEKKQAFLRLIIALEDFERFGLRFNQHAAPVPFTDEIKKWISLPSIKCSDLHEKELGVRACMMRDNQRQEVLDLKLRILFSEMRFEVPFGPSNCSKSTIVTPIGHLPQHEISFLKSCTLAVPNSDSFRAIAARRIHLEFVNTDGSRGTMRLETSSVEALESDFDETALKTIPPSNCDKNSSINRGLQRW